MIWYDMMCIFVSTSAGSPRVLRDWETHYLAHPAQEFNILRQNQGFKVLSNGAEAERLVSKCNKNYESAEQNVEENKL